MGVQGLWQLLESTGRPVTLESLEGKVLAVDVSIWLHQAMRGMRDEQGNVATNAHLLVLFNRICKLLFYRIKPIFVFDGGVPQLKKQTLVARRQRREMAASKSKRTADKMLKNYMRTHALNAVMGGSKQNKGPSVPKLSRISSQEPDLFQLPPMPESSEDSQEDGDQPDDTWKESQEHLADFAPHAEDAEKMDIDSDVFRALPLEIQHELITEMKEKGKKTSWKKISQLPKQAGDFSSYQLSKLLNKGKMTQRLDQLRKEMKVKNTGAVASMLDFENSMQELHAGRVMSEDTEHYVLVKTKPTNKDGTENDDASKASSSGGSQPVASNESLEETSQETSQGVVTEVKGQGASSAPWDIDLTLVEDDSPLSPDKSKEITEAVKSFFAKNNLQSKQQTNLDTVNQGQRSVLNSKGQVSTAVTGQTTSGAVDNEVMVLSDNDVRTSVSPSSADEVEIISVKEGRPKKSLQFLFSTAIDKLVHSALNDRDNNASNDVVASDTKDRRTRSNSGSSNEDDVMIVDEDESSSASPHDVKVPEVADAASNKRQPENKMVIPMMSSLLDRLVASALSQDTVTRDSTQNDEKMSKEGGKGGDGENIKVSDSDDDDDDDFVDVPFYQDKPSVKQEPLPHGASTPPVSVSEVSSVTPSLTPTEKESVNAEVVVKEEEEEKGEEEEEEKEEEEKEEEEKEEEEKEEEANNEEDKSSEKSEAESSDSVNDSEVAMETSDQDSQGIPILETVEEWAGMNVANTSELQNDLESERLVLATERRKHERVAVSITDVMYAESKELLQLFGLPFIDSPQEAEAQCAYLDHTNQTQGTITDDSDIWLFGGCYVYKNFFTKGKDVEFFRSTDFEKQLMLSRDKLIQLAYLLGSDYTEGVQGVGWVTAMEVLTEFPGEDLDGLKNFKEWWDRAQKQLKPPVESLIKSKLRKVTVYPGFPNPHVKEAYLQPVIDESKEEFSWGSPDLDLLRDFATEKFGWNRSRTDEMLLPVLRKLNEKKVQSKISHFFPMEHHEPRKIKSKRLQKVLKKLKNPNMESEDSATEEKSQKKRGRPSKKQKLEGASGEGEMENSQEKVTRRGGKRKSKQSNKSSGADETADSDTSDEYVPSVKVSKEVKGQSRSSGRISKKAVKPSDSVNHGTEEEKEIVPNLSTEGSVASRQSKSAVNNEVTPKGATGITDGRGSKGRGNNRGRGKGRVGVKGKGKLLAKKGRGKGHLGNVDCMSGPKLSESSSNDSD